MLKREEIISLLLYMLKNFLISQNKNESITLFCFAYFDKFRSRRCMRILSCTLFLFFTFFLRAVPSDVIFLWPGKAPGEKKGEIEAEFEKPPKDSNDVLRISNVSKPSMKVFPADPKNANGAAVLVCPGGGYSILAYEHEGLDVCEWLNSFGVTAILLKYRVPRRKGREKHDAPLQDAQRAMGLIRQNAKAWNIATDKIGILGFSAGGNLAVLMSTSFKVRTYHKIDNSDELSCRPDFSILIYPAYLVDRKGRSQLFPEIQVSPECPPCFFAHTGDDHVPAEGSALLYLALKKAGVTGNELHLYPFGGHGYGMRKSKDFVSTWPSRAKEWMSAIGVLKK
jgi:acetyl esterase/lipase